MIIYDKLEDKIIFKSTYLDGFIAFVNIIAEENGDENMVIVSLVDAVNYINNYCDTLILEI